MDKQNPNPNNVMVPTLKIPKTSIKNHSNRSLRISIIKIIKTSNKIDPKAIEIEIRIK